jgi:hypothetical protein
MGSLRLEMRILPALFAAMGVFCSFAGRAESDEPRECSLPRLPDTRGWSDVISPDGRFRFRLPPEFVSDEGAGFIHGGHRWETNAAGFEVVFGHWSPSSFSPSEPDCRTKIKDVELTLFWDGSGAVAWVTSPSAGSNTVFGTGGSAQPWALMLNVLQTLTYDPAGRPPDGEAQAANCELAGSEIMGVRCRRSSSAPPKK